jgi:hypothetical protein
VIKHFTKMSKITIAVLIATCSLPTESYGQSSRPVRYAKSEVQKATGKCVAAVFFGGILGGVVGGAVDGRRGAARGLGSGAIVCALIMSTAKRKDRIIAAQIAAASAQNGSFSTSFNDDNGRPIQLQTQASTPQTIEGARLTPVKYEVSGGQVASPVLDTGGQECRVVSGSIAGAEGIGVLPDQYVCRTPSGDYAPYELGRARRT